MPLRENVACYGNVRYSNELLPITGCNTTHVHTSHPRPLSFSSLLPFHLSLGGRGALNHSGSLWGVRLKGCVEFKEEGTLS